MQEPSHNAKVRISLESGELEVQGPQAFIQQYEQAIASLLERLLQQPPKEHSLGPKPGTSGGSLLQIDEFPEALHGMTSNSGTDQILVAGYFASQVSPDATFSTGEANKLLIEQGIKLPNPSQSLKANLTAKRLFKAGSRYKISKSGSDQLRILVRVAGNS